MNKQAFSNIDQSIKIFSEAQSKRHQESIEEDRKREDRFLQYEREKREKDRFHEMRMAQIFTSGTQNQQHSTQPSTLYLPRGNEVTCYSQHMHRLSPVSPIENNFYFTPKQQPASVSSYNGDDTPHCSQSFFNESQNS